jgi:CSLREA domain-containing protein
MKCARVVEFDNKKNGCAPVKGKKILSHLRDAEGRGIMKTRHAVAAGSLLWICSVSLAFAAVFNVNTLTDAVDSDTSDGICLTASAECSLRAAVQQANASSGADVIDLMDGIYSLSLTGIREDNAATGDLDINSEITINGNGASLVKIDALRADRVFQVHTGAKLTLNALTVSDGVVQLGGGGGGVDVYQGYLVINDCLLTLNYSTSMGGAINNIRGNVLLNRSVVNQNSSDNVGAGINNQDGDLFIHDSTISNNLGGVVLGGAIYNSAWAKTLEITNSTISGHSVGLDGGAIYHLLGELKITNTTISGNYALRNGGGLFYSSATSDSGGSAELVNVTITDNKGVKGGGGLYVRGPLPLQMANSIVAGNAIGSDCYLEASIASHGHNLDGDGSCGLVADTTSISNGVAALDVLADNGGFTLTHALLASSDALDAADDTRCPLDDQRGYTRPLSGCDIGAYEAEGVEPIGLDPSQPTAVDLSAQSINTAPMAVGQLLSATAGGIVEGTLAALDAEGDTLVYEIVRLPTKGRVGWNTGVAGAFTYEADYDVSGTDSFTFRACDPLVCSDPATVNISIELAQVAGEMSIDLAPGTDGTVGPLSVISSNNLDATYSDVDYTQSLGVFVFDVNDIPTDPNSQENGTVVVIQLSPDAVIDSGAVIRKMDNTNVWRTMGSTPDPLVSTGTIDPVAKTITLVLRDNDMFDSNLTVGVIRDPVAIAVKNGASKQMTQVVEASPYTGASGASESGGGMLHPVMLVLLGLLGLGRRRLN